MRYIGYFALSIILSMLMSAGCCPVKKEAPAKAPAAQKEVPVQVTEDATPPVTTLPESPQSAGQPDRVAPSASGPSTTTMNQDVPSGWPEDVPIMPGFEKGASTATGTVIMYMAVSNVPIDKVEEFYSGLEGWTKEVARNVQQDPNSRVFTLKKDNRTVNVNINTDGTNTRLELVYSSQS